MKKVIVGILCIVALGMVYLVYNVYSENVNLRQQISDRSDLIIKNENDKELYQSKQKELEDIKESNKDKAGRYDEVEVWNQEIIKYLD